jgi:cytochrome c
MNTYELNKIAGAVLATALFIMGMQTLAGIVYTGNKPDKLAYSVEVEEETGGGTDTTTEPEVKVSMAEMLAEANVDKGAKVMKKCGQCHTWNKGGDQKIGPNLYGIMGRQIATVEGFTYSDALKAKATEIGTWSYEAIDAFITSPKKFAKGTKMVFPGIRKIKQRADLIMYLRDQSDSPMELPAAPEPAAE